MASIEEKTKFIAMCSNIIRDNYSGDPLTLSSFIDKIDLIQELMSDNLEKCFITFIKSKLDGKAREVLPESILGIEQIKQALNNRIRPDNSKVVAGRLAVLHVKNNNYTDFAKNVEELADALQRSLVMEGITKDKAQELVIEQTVKICRKNAKSDMVRAIIASTIFKEPKDVVSKLIVEESANENEHQVLTVRYNRPTQHYNRNSIRNNDYNHHNSNRGNSINNDRSYRNSNNNYHAQNGNFRGRNYNTRGGYRRNRRQAPMTTPGHGHNFPAVRTLNEEVPQQAELGVNREYQN